MACLVPGCKNVKRLMSGDSGISFHRFPKEPNRFKKWLEAIGIDANIIWSENKFVCSKHFKPEDLLKYPTRTLTSKDAVPIKRFESESEFPSSSEDKNQFIVLVNSPRLSPRKRVMSSSTDTASEVEFERVLGKYSPKAISKHPEHQIYASNSQIIQQQPTPTGWISSSSDSSLNNRRKVIKLEHSYVTSPASVKRKQKFLKTKLTVQQLRKKVVSITQVLKNLKSRNSLSTNALEHLEKTFGDIPGNLMSRILKSARTGSLSRAKYPDMLRKFALTLHFYSSKAYDYVRRTFHLALPHPSVLRKWSATVECEPGFSTLCFETLKVRVKEAHELNKKVVCSFVLDEMAIKKQIEYDGRRNWGFIDLGIDLEHDQVDPASEALVLMVVSLNASWKLPIAYFFIKSLTGIEKANIVREALVRLHQIGVEITSMTCDGPTAHFGMFKELGCDFTDVDNLKNYFTHPADPNKKIYSILDMCPMLKLLRNSFSQLEVLRDSTGEEIKWFYIKRLQELQEEKTLALANKLKNSHIAWQKQKMKVNLAAQTLSSSVAKALFFLQHEMKHPDFQGCHATIKFIETIDKFFDLLNSRLPWAKGYKSPLKASNETVWRPFLTSSMKYILSLRDVGGKNLWKTPKKIPFLGFAISIKSVIGIFDDFVRTGLISYFPTYKVSQDHLELFSAQSRNGWNNNPSALQFMRTFRKLLLHTDVSGGQGNCRVLDTTSILTVSSGTKNDPIINEIDMLSLRKHNITLETIIAEDHNYNIVENFISLDEYCENVVTYIAGYVVKMMKKTLHCSECLSLTTHSDQEITNAGYSFLNMKNQGGFLIPSKGIRDVCAKTEIFIRKWMYITNNPFTMTLHPILKLKVPYLLVNVSLIILYEIL